MKISKSELKRLIKEELELFEAEHEEPPQAAAPKLKGDVEVLLKRLNSLSGLDKILASINTMDEFAQVLMQFIKMASAANISDADVKLATRKVAQQVLQSK